MVQSLGRIGWKAARERLTAHLDAGTFSHEPDREAGKNLLAEGIVSVAEVRAAIQRAKGRNHREEADNRAGTPTNRVVHIISGVNAGGRVWYIKWYFEPDAVFISVH